MQKFPSSRGFQLGVRTNNSPMCRALIDGVCRLIGALSVFATKFIYAGWSIWRQVKTDEAMSPWTEWVCLQLNVEFCIKAFC